MISVLAATTGNTPLAFIELGVVAIGLAVLARLADRLGIPPVPLYLLAGLAVGDGGFVTFDVSEDFISRASDIGVLLLLLTLGLEYTGDELKAGLRSGAVTGIADAALNFLPGFAWDCSWAGRWSPRSCSAARRGSAHRASSPR